MDKLTAMNAFVRLVQAGTFKKAADSLNTPASSMTRLIQSLERDLKVRLLHRTTRSMTITPEGAAYYERVVKLLSDLSDIESAAKLRQGNLTGRVRVELPAAIGDSMVIASLPEFYARYPSIEIEIDINNSQADVGNDRVDCAIRLDTGAGELLVARQVGYCNFVTCADPSFLERYGEPATVEDLKQLPTIGMEYGRTGHPLAFRFRGEQQSAAVALKHHLVVNDRSSYVAAAMAGIGVIQVPTLGEMPEIKSGDLKEILTSWKAEAAPLNMVYAPDRYLNASVRVFVDWMASLFDGHAKSRSADGFTAHPRPSGRDNGQEEGREPHQGFRQTAPCP